MHGKQREVKMLQKPTKTGSTAAAEERRRRMHGSVSPRGREPLDVERGLLELGGIIGDENERAETDLWPSANPPPETMMMEIKKTATSPEVAKTPAPRWGPTVVVLSLAVRVGVRMRRQDPSYGEVVHARFTSAGPSQRK